MEYLPEKRRTQKTQILKKEAKIADFRNYLADEQVVLGLVKCKQLRSGSTNVLQSLSQSGLSSSGRMIRRVT